MQIRDILVCLDSSEAGNGRLRLALALARSRSATLTALYALPQPRITAPAIGLGPLPPPIVHWTEPPAVAGPPRESERADEAEALFRSELRAGGLDGEWHLLDERDLPGLVEFANIVDLTILGQISPDAPGESALAPDSVVTEIGRPLLVVPYAGSFETVGRRTLIAWDGSREAARAVNDALPLIESAEAVTVLYVGAGEAQLERARPALDRIVRHLQRHAIKARGEGTARGDIPISDLLLSRAADLGIDLLVAGAYHHSPLREALLGGVSRDLLRHMTVPVLMSH
jgi:nucleotide-binding universal stress UspA family protein